jgi:hypothetical protein
MKSFAGIPELLEAMDRDVSIAKTDLEKYLN